MGMRGYLVFQHWTGGESPLGSAALRAVIVILGIVMLGAAVASRNGLFTPTAALLAVGASVLVVGALLFNKKSGVEYNANAGETPTSPWSLLRVVATVAMLVNGWWLFRAPALNDVAEPPAAWVARVCWGVLVGCCVGIVWMPMRWVRWAVLGACVFLVIGGAWVIRSNPAPWVDVWLFQQEGCAALMRGKNPWAIRYENPYPREQWWVYGEGVVRGDGRLDFGYPYLPVTLVGVLPGYLAWGDYRWALLAWVVVPVGLVGWRASREMAIGLGLLLTFPKLPMVVEWGWSEPVSVGLLVLTVRWRVMEWVVVVSKQYLLPLVVVVAGASRLCSRSESAAIAASMQGRDAPATRKQFLMGSLTIAVTLAFVLWSPSAFWGSAMALQFRQPFREDSLSLAALVYSWWGVKVSSLVALGATGALAVWMGWRRVGVVVAAGVVLPVLFLLSKQAFLNYWFLVYSVWCLGVGVLARSEEAPHCMRGCDGGGTVKLR